MAAKAISVMAYASQNSSLATVQHGLKNLMAIVRSIAARSMEHALGFEDYLAHFDGRLAALSRTQNMLARSGSFEIDVEELLREELLAQQADERARLSGPPVLLGQRAAENVGLAIHELAINALKFGALGQAQAQLEIQWHVEGGELVLEWRESGVAAVVLNPARRGFGREMIESALAYQLNAKASLGFHPGGVVAVIRIPEEHFRTEGVLR